MSFVMENFPVLEGLSYCVDGTATDTTQISKAKGKIVLSLDPPLYVHVKVAKTVTEWDPVKDLYEYKAFTRKISFLH